MKSPSPILQVREPLFIGGRVLSFTFHSSLSVWRSFIVFHLWHRRGFEVGGIYKKNAVSEPLTTSTTLIYRHLRFAYSRFFTEGLQGGLVEQKIIASIVILLWAEYTFSLLAFITVSSQSIGSSPLQISNRDVSKSVSRSHAVEVTVVDLPVSPDFPRTEDAFTAT